MTASAFCSSKRARSLRQNRGMHSRVPVWKSDLVARRLSVWLIKPTTRDKP